MNKKLTGRFFRENVICDKIIKSKDQIKFRNYFFYTHGRTAESFKNGIEKQLTKLGIDFQLIDYCENWQAWPKDSYFEVIIKLEEI